VWDGTDHLPVNEPRVAVFLPGLRIEGRESEVARLGFPRFRSRRRPGDPDRGCLALLSKVAGESLPGNVGDSL
jgi:hypothetical protein